MSRPSGCAAPGRGAGPETAVRGHAARISALALAVQLAAAACGADRPGPPRIGEPARDYAAATLDGDTVALASLRGDVVLLNLWATWCKPCREETPYLQSLYEEHRDEGLEIVGVSLDTRGAAAQVEHFVDQFGVTYTVLHDPAMRGMELYQVLGLPATFLIDREGVLRWMRYGPIREGDAEFLRALDDVLS